MPRLGRLSRTNPHAPTSQVAFVPAAKKQNLRPAPCYSRVVPGVPRFSPKVARTAPCFGW